ncbi:MAG: biotin/lipoyl-containing protein [Armatimonadia bacterium]
MGQLITIEKWAENLEEVTLNRWLKQEGDRVEEGDSLCEIITDKVTFEYELETPGVLLRTYCPERSVLPIGFAIAFLGAADEALPEGVEAENQRLLQAHTAKAALELDLEVPAGKAVRQPQRPVAEHRVRATPAARRVAREAGVAIEEVANWKDAPEAVTEADVEAYLQQR